MKKESDRKCVNTRVFTRVPSRLTAVKANGRVQANLLEEQRACRERLQVIKDKTYLLQDTTVLTRVRSLLDSIILDMQENLATENGVPLEPDERRKPIKKAGGTKYLPLTKRKGKSKFSRRAGTKATVMRKTYMVNVPVTAPKVSERSNAKHTKKATCDCGNHEIEIGEEDHPPETTKLEKLMILSRTQHLLTSILLPTSFLASKPTH